MRRLFLALMLTAIVAARVPATVVHAQSICRTADANSGTLITWLNRFTSATSGDDLASRNILKLPFVPTGQLSLVTQDATCRKAKTTYESHATAQGGTGLSGRVYVVQVGTAYAVVDPEYHWGPDPGWWLLVTMDSRFKKLAYTTTHGASQ